MAYGIGIIGQSPEDVSVSVEEALAQAGELLQRQRWAALATLDSEGLPEGSMVAYAIFDNRLILHLSELASHSRNLQRQPLAALTISENDDGIGDPQQLARLSLRGRTTRLERSARDYNDICESYIARLPDAAPLFDFGDFNLYTFTPERGRFVGGFGQAHTLTATRLRALLRSHTP